MKHSTYCVMLLIILVLLSPSIADERVQDLYLGGNTTDVSAAANAISETSEDTDYLQFRDKVGKFTIIYPKGSVVAASGDENSTDTSFLTPSNVTLLKVNTAPTTQSVDTIINQVEKKITQIPDFHMIDNTNITIAQNPARQIEYTWTDKTGSLSRTKQVFTIYDDRLIVITAQFPDTLFQEFAPILEKMIESITLIPVSHKPQGWYFTQYGWIWYPDAADLARWNWDHYSGNNYFSSTDYWGTGMDWIDVSNARWDWYMNSGD